jgi:hypothetical protein
MARFVGARFRLIDQLARTLDLAQLPANDRKKARRKDPPIQVMTASGVLIQDMFVKLERLHKKRAGLRECAVLHSHQPQKNGGHRNVQVGAGPICFRQVSLRVQPR